MSILHIDSLTKSYRSKKILQDIYLRCETGKIIGVLGRIGEGKTTLLQIIFGTIKADFQFIKLNNEILTKQSDRKNKIAYLSQQPMFPKNIKVRKLISLFCDSKNTEKLYSLNLVQPFLDKSLRNLSGGETKLMEVLIIIYSKAEFILLEQPYSGLSPIFTEKLKKIIKEISKEKGFIISDFNAQQAIDISDKIYLLSDSHLKPIKDLKELQQYYYLPKNI
ncbi:ATP-binding cassette domain-containing protein [Chryseobacterium balustinum]|uniref:ABC-type lipopolysaccharide export system, ATPase component n=1 Tax=Chryseobacterium balustinum TaxID=246 RepID=A0AAX2IJF1_9FLAO|nr:ATP-binding cassette domain-containing protein [Chryseobacterium balustinum]AZB30440.1 ABC transporter ATP-binding protein [Chryseobacterium balustinum]SKB47612.1 ABC-type lipopolysaccharide export system, ATPase component [Chryseobacterium balustinum]SQA89157.1 Lipopolysaccharide export system ATP-binding protein LptB [Chryseobacterium balustinum]